MPALRLRLGAALALGAVAALLAAGIAAAQQQAVALADNHPLETAMLSAHAAPDRPLTLRITFALRDRAALSRLLADQQDPSSPRFHKWLTPAEFEARFGRAPAEQAAVRAWLERQGMRIVRASPREVVVNTNVAQAEAAFATRIETSADETVFGNRTDPQLPAALAPLIGSIDGLDNLRHWAALGLPRTRPTSNLLRPKVESSLTQLASATTGRSSPNYNNGDGTAFGPSDLYTFYDESSLLDGGTTGASGKGDCIAIAEDSDYLSSAVTLFDTNFSLATANVTEIYPDGSSPGENGDENEALLDIEWSHAVAPGSPIDVYVGSGSDS
ncbi:MAG TPA: protease pro-enzyme activation domain-containing protein, partial [Candidatus Binataceae bacterium]|nr:protease pro-enzyme activation domain-containing protein [Candidatus Binataceae bacterium]